MTQSGKKGFTSSLTVSNTTRHCGNWYCPGSASQKPVTTELLGHDSVTEVLLCDSHCAVFVGTVKYHVCAVFCNFAVLECVLF